MNKSTEALLCEFIEENNIATEAETRLVVDINGWNEETMMDIIYARTGLRSIEQCNEEGCYYLSEELLDRFGLNEEEEEEEDNEDEEEGED